MPLQLTGEHNAAKARLAIVVARFNHEITDRLLSGALEAIQAAGGDVEAIPIARVPGSLELAVVARKFATVGRCDAVICLGCVVRGETTHYDCVVDGATMGIAAVAAETGVPIIFGVLTCDTWEQALARSDRALKLNTGSYAAYAAIEMADLMKQIKSPAATMNKTVRKKTRRRA